MKRNEITRGYMAKHASVAVLVLISSIVTVCYAATTGVTVTEELETTKERVSISTTVDGVKVSFGDVSGSIPKPSGGILSASLTVAEGAFVGNYDAAGVKGLGFNAILDGSETALITVEFQGASSERIWRLFGVESQAVLGGGESSINVSFDMVAGWQWTGSSQMDAEWRFLEDLQDVAYIGLSIVRGGETAHTCTINSFKLLLPNETATPTAVLEAKLLDAFGVTSVDQIDTLRDSDKDGQTDYEEIMSTQTDYLDANSAMAIRACVQEEGGMRIVWDSVVNGEYDVKRANSVAGPYDTVVAAGLVGTINGTMDTLDETAVAGEGPYFYRVIKTN